MWKRLKEAAFLANQVSLGEDFTNSKETDRRGSIRERQMRKREATTWHHMTLQYDLSDA
jgi:hypothetical protein